MATPINDNYTTLSGGDIYAGMLNPNPPVTAEQLDSVTLLSTGASPPHPDLNQTLVFTLHASGGGDFQTSAGRLYQADVSGRLAVQTYNTWRFQAVRGVDSLGNRTLNLSPSDYYDRYPSNVMRESYHMGFTGIDGSPELRLCNERRYDALLLWAESNLPLHPTKRCMTGGSMGAWGTLSYGIRRASKFAALYPDRPRWRYNNNFAGQQVTIPNFASGGVNYTSANSPILSADDGGTPAIAHMDIIAYVSNTTNKVPWIGWCIGVNDGFTNWLDHVAAVNALRAAKRGFAFAWNGGNHSSGSIMNQVRNSYPYGMFEIGKGYPLFTNHSGDDDINVTPTIGDLTTRGINLGLSFRNVVETATSWSCEVTSILGARTVSVEPISDIFTAEVSPQTINIPAANTWVQVTFNL